MRIDGYAAIEDYAVLSDGRVLALVARDGSIDWLPIPTIAQSGVFAALLDAEHGGRWVLAPRGDYVATRRYVPQTNVVETTFTTATGVVTVTDALTLQEGGLVPWIELARGIECTRGKVTMRWVVEPRFDYGRQGPDIRLVNETPVARGGRAYLGIQAWDAGSCELNDASICGERQYHAGDRGLLVCIGVDNEPIPMPPRAEVEVRFKATIKSWRRWIGDNIYDGPWRIAVERSALALKALIYVPSGAMTAAATTSLPESMDGSRNYDYRFAWVRDAAFTIDALGRLGYREQVHQSLSWLLQATTETHPELRPLYALDGTVPDGETELPLTGWRNTRPVHEGNAAAKQLQIGAYGDLLETIRMYCFHGNLLDDDTAGRVIDYCNRLCGIWRNEDSGFWELSDTRHYTSSKILAWAAFDRALGLWKTEQINPDEATRERWLNEQAAIREFLDQHCWSQTRGAYSFYAGTDELDATILLNARFGFIDPAGERFCSTIDAVRKELAAGGPLLYRFSGMRGKEGAFVACSFWLVTALARAGRLDEAREQMEAMLELANDVGLYSEEIDPHTHAFRGNMPQALSHLALVDAASILHEVEKRGHFPARAAPDLSR